jgi:hypothetical protein
LQFWAFGVLTAAAIALFIWRTALSGVVFPTAATLIAALQKPAPAQGLAIEAVTCSRDVEAGTPVLAVDGKITNVSSEVLEVPRLRFALRDHVGREVYAWTAVPTGALLAPGGSVPFASRVASAPESAKEISVRFWRHRDTLSR